MSGSGSSDLAKGGNFTNQWLYVQHVDKEKDMASTITRESFDEIILRLNTFPDSFISELLIVAERMANGKSTIFDCILMERIREEVKRQELIDEIAEILSDRNFSDNLKANVVILKSSLKDVISHVEVYSNPLPATAPTSEVAFQNTFVSFKTDNLETKGEMWWSLEKNEKYIVLQQSPYKDDVIQKIYDDGKKELVQRLGPVKLLDSAMGNSKDLGYLLRAIWDGNLINTNYHLLFSNCQNFASFIFEKANGQGKKWSTPLSAFVDVFISRNKKTNSIGAQRISSNTTGLKKTP